MTIEEQRKEKRESYEALLRKACAHVRDHWEHDECVVVEYGPGRSTEIIAECLPKNFRIISIEHDQGWYAKAAARLRVLIATGRVDLRLRVISMSGGKSEGYVTEPLRVKLASPGMTVPLVFVDGRFRLDCLMIAREVTAPCGIVVVHDAHRQNYRMAFRYFKDQFYDAATRTAVLDLPLSSFCDQLREE